MTELDQHATITPYLEHLDRWWERSGRDQAPRGRVLGSALDQASETDNPYWEVVRRLPLSRWSDGGLEVDGAEFYDDAPPLTGRRALVKAYSWAVPTPTDLSWLLGRLDGRGVVEVGAGTGYWAWQLSQLEVDVLAFDAEPCGETQYCGPTRYHPVHAGDASSAAAHPDRALLLCWPPYSDPLAAAALRLYSGDLLVYVGEGSGGCCADDGFFEELEADWECLGYSPGHATFWGIHCDVSTYRRRPAGGDGDAR